jgi:hypothetical protein
MEFAVVLLLIALAIGAVMWPLVRRDAAAPDPVPGPAAAPAEGMSMAEIEREVARYREALRSGTVCPKCAQANPAGSRFCSDCGRRLSPVEIPSPVSTAT